MKKRDFEPKLQPFLKIFEQLTHRHDVYQVFQDYILICLNYMGNGNFIEERDARIKTYKPEEHKLFNQCFEEMVRLLDREIQGPNDWYDCFGNFYQVITSNWKSSAMGQFFTPDPVVTMMVKMLCIDRGESKMMFTQAEPCSGSGRFIIAAHANNPMGFYWAVDLDPMCAQMTAVNMALHNTVGVVLQTNGLWEDKEFTRAYHVARLEIAENVFVPCIYPVATYAEAQEIFEKYRTFAHTYNMAYHFREYMGLKPPPLFDEEKVIEIIENSVELKDELEEENFERTITEEIKEVIIEQVKAKNNNIQNQLSLFE